MSQLINKQIVLENIALAQALEQLPNGESVTWLKSKLDENDFQEASRYIFGIILTTLFATCNDELKTKINELIENEEYEDLLSLFIGLCVSSDQNPEAELFQLQAVRALDLGVKTVAIQYKLDLNS